MRKLFFTIMLTSVCALSQATTLHFNDNERLNLDASVENVNRLFVKGDKITQHVAPSNTFIFDSAKAKDGSVYFKPAIAGRTFTIFFATEHGHHFSAVIHPVMGEGSTTKLVANNLSDQDITWAKNTPYLSALQKLMLAMIKGNDSEISIQKISDSRFNKFNDEIALKIIGVANAHHLNGIAYEVANISSHDVNLSNRMFWHKGVLAVSLFDQVIKAHQHSKLWMISAGSLS